MHLSARVGPVAAVADCSRPHTRTPPGGKDSMRSDDPRITFRLSAADRIQQREVDPYGVAPQQLEDVKTQRRSWGLHLHDVFHPIEHEAA